MPGRNWIVAGAVLAALGVGLGAFGAHGLEGWVEKTFESPAEQAKRLANWNTGVRYHLFHAFGILLIGFGSSRLAENWRRIAGILMVLGIALFSGCLYSWVLTSSRTLVMIVPLGGLAFILSWVSVAIGAARCRVSPGEPQH